MSTGLETGRTRLTPIGPWMFDAEDGALRGADGERKMEDRAARTLALLCARRGEIVSQATILDMVWQGRHVSPNSVAVVIADIRRALGEKAREPLYIETVAKRGYRLKAIPAVLLTSGLIEPALHSQLRPKHRLLVIVAVVVALLGTAYGVSRRLEISRIDLPIAVGPVRNETGSGAYSSLASAMGELLVNRIAAFDAVDVYRSGRPEPTASSAPGLVVQSKLILWNGIPTLSITTEDGLGHVIWTGMVEGQPNTLARNTVAELAGLRRRVAERTQGAGAAATHLSRVAK